ncbi:gasdermin-E isoform X1 [Python bivittatus]|uniref:Gasdermin-E isoform X1 n=1 Tax=Python bivittatus TaxID=176946 RepID=A0A9F2R1A6_PYTBI|nr:gasdermin-E isoform X1 [Python bivittatus]XP_007433152.1 gasdermin-E isoform X1 [Python bivittatus]
MFAKATKTFVKEVDCGGDLISVSSLNNLDKLQFLNLVTKKKKTWCWQNPKYHLLSITLNDVLAEDVHDPIKPVIIESDFVKYEGKFEDCIGGSIETSLGRISLGTGGRDIVESRSSFGNLKKQEVDLHKLMKDVKGRSINLQTSLLQQMLQRKHDVLCILTEKIMTTQKCLISEHIQKEEKLAGMVGISTKIIKVSVSENGNMIKNSNVVLEIPAPTAIAYGVIELYIRRDGQFEFCLLHDQQGGFERGAIEGPSYRSLAFEDACFPHPLDAVDNEKLPGPESPIPTGASLSILSKDVLQLKTQFQPFMNLSEEKQRALYRMVCHFLLHEETVMQLENVMDNICSEDSPGILVMEELKSPEEPCLEEFLQLVGVHLQSRPLIHNKELFLAVHLLLSAVAELSSYSLVLLLACCDLQLVPTLCFLPNMTSEDGTMTLADPILAPLAHPERFRIAQKLFALSNINLEMTETSIKAATMKKSSFSPIILYIALNGLHTLGCERDKN